MPSSTAPTFDPVAKSMHWLVACAVFGILIVAALMGNPDWTPGTNRTLYTAHKTLGVLIFFMAVFRLVWKHRNPPPPWSSTMPRWQVIAARIVHAGLYLLLLLLPLVGWAMVSSGHGSIQFFGLLPLPAFPGIGAMEQAGEIHAWLRETHEALANLLAVLIVVHIGATFLHHFVDRDDILLRISPVALTPFLEWLRRVRLP